MFVDIYTGTPLIGTGVELQKLLEKHNRGDIYLIGSGETAESRNYYLGNGIQAVIEAYKPETLFTGVDKKTKVYRFPLNN